MIASSDAGPCGVTAAISQAYLDALKRHLKGILRDGECLFPDGGWKLSSTSDNSWLSKIYLSQFVAHEVRLKPCLRELSSGCGDSDAIGLALTTAVLLFVASDSPLADRRQLKGGGRRSRQLAARPEEQLCAAQNASPLSCLIPRRGP